MGSMRSKISAAQDDMRRGERGVKYRQIVFWLSKKICNFAEQIAKQKP